MMRLKEDDILGVVVTKLEAGLPLARCLYKAFHWSEKDIMRILLSYAKLLAKLEANGIIHEDPTAMNLIIDHSPEKGTMQVTVIDLGLSYLPKLAATQIESKSDWATNGKDCFWQGLEAFGTNLEDFHAYATNRKLDRKFTKFLQNFQIRFQKDCKKPIHSYRELSQILEKASMLVSKKSFKLLKFAYSNPSTKLAT